MASPLTSGQIRRVRSDPPRPLSIHDGVDEPAAGLAIAKHTVDRAVAQRDVPFVAVPTRSLKWLPQPPIPRRSPGTGALENHAAGVPATISRHAQWASIGSHRHARGHWLSTTSQR